MAKPQNNDDIPIVLNEFVPYLFNRVTNLLNHDMKDALRALNLTIPRWRILAVLIEKDGMSIGEIAHKTALDHTATSRVIGQMEREQLISRKASDKDSRVSHTFLTDKGREVFGLLSPKALKNQDTALQGLEEKELNQLKNILYKILENIDKTSYIRR